MDAKVISSGAVFIALASAAIALENKETVKHAFVAASEKIEDVAVTAIAKASPETASAEIPEKTCTRMWVEVRPNPPALHWLCDGAYLPQAQEYLDGMGADAVEVKLKPRDDGKGGVVFDAHVRRGEMPARPAEEKEEAKGDELQEVPAQ